MKTGVWSTSLNLFVNLFFLTCTLSDDTMIPEPQERLNGFFNPQTDQTALDELRSSADFSKKMFFPDGPILYTNVTTNPEDNVFGVLAPISDEEMTVVVTPCLSPITWKVFYRVPNDSMELKSDGPSVLPGDELLHEYSGDTQSLSTDRGVGLHLVQVFSKENTTIQMHASTQMGGQTLLHISSIRTKNKIMVEKIFGVSPRVHLTLPEVPLESDPEFQYYLVFVISRRKYYNSICNVQASHPEKISYFRQENHCDHLQDDSELQVCREDGRVRYIDLKLQPESSYYVSVFAWDLNGFSVLFANSFFKFKKFPLRLFDGKPERMNMRTNKGKISFKYKVPKLNVTTDAKIFFYVLPCGHSDSMHVEIKHEKKVIRERRISTYRKFDVPNPKANHRYVIKIRTVSPKTVDTDVCDSIEVMATMRPNAFPLPPHHSSDLRVNATAVCTVRSGGNDRVIAVISWLPIKTDEILYYCVTFIENPLNKTADIFKSADIFYPLVKNSPIHGCVHILRPESSFSLMIKRLKPHLNYAIQVIVKKNRESKEFLSYNILNAQFEHPENCRSNKSIEIMQNFTNLKQKWMNRAE